MNSPLHTLQRFFKVEAASCRLAEPLPITRQAARCRFYFSQQFQSYPTIAWIHFTTCIRFMNWACSRICNCPSDIRRVMDPEQAKNLVKEQTHLITQWVCERCGKEDKRLIPLALLHVNQRLSEQDWQLIRQYDGKQPFEEFVRELVEEALETFLNGVWFGKCAKTINYWLKRYNVEDQIKRQDAEDYVKDKLTKDNFARFRSYRKEHTTCFPTYISVVIRNLLIDFLRKKKPATESLDNTDGNGNYYEKTLTDDTEESYGQEHLEEIGRWFFAGAGPQENDEASAHAPDVPDAIKLSPKERLFLRAIYKDEMSFSEAGKLPGINMSRLQAYNYHRRLKKRVKELLHAIGYENLQSLLTPTKPTQIQ